MNSKQISKFRIPFSISILSAGFALMMYGYIGTYNRLMGDSLCSYYYAERLGLLRSIWFWRRIWSGRYSAYGFDWLLTILLEPKNVPYFIPVILIIWVAANTWVIFLIFRKISERKRAFPLALLLGPTSVFLILATSPYIQQSFFWIDGFRAYTLPVIVLAIYAIIYFLFIDRVNTKLQIGTASLISFVLFFASGGLSETFSAFQFSLLTFGIIYYWLIERQVKFDKTVLILTSGWIGSAVSIFVIFTAPGNAVRQSFFPPPPDTLNLLYISFNAYKVFLYTIWSTPHKALALLGGVLASASTGMFIAEKLNQHGRKIILQIAGAVLLSFACFPPGVFGYSEPPPDRVLIIATFILITLLMSAGFWAGNLLKQSIQNDHGVSIAISIFAALFLLSAAWINSKNLYESRFEYIEYANEWDKTDAIIKEAKSNGEEVVIVKSVSNWAGMDQLNNNPNHWVNECYSYFYGIQVFGSP